MSDLEYRRLLEFRTGLRRFLRWSENQAAAVGLTPAQHQLLLAVRGHLDPRGPTVGDLAASLLLRHHSVGELITRAESAHLVRRSVDPDDARVVRLVLTRNGAKRLEKLALTHVEELRRLASSLQPVWQGLQGDH